MAEPSEPQSRNDFEIAIICALPLEADAVQALFDHFWDERAYGKASGDRNTYTLGVMGSHNVVLVHMPRMGKTSAATVAASLGTSFQQINLTLVTGICGGVPNGTDEEKEILLGDVIISTGLVQYDFGRRFDDRFIGLDVSMPSDEIQGFLNKLRVQRIRKRLAEKTSGYLADLYHERHYQNAKYVGIDEDKLFEPTYRHKHRGMPACNLCTTCTTKENRVCEAALELSCADLNCDTNQQLDRDRLKSPVGIVETSNEGDGVSRTTVSAHPPIIHFGLIASGDTIMKSGEQRDTIAAKKKVIAFEMEGAGVWDTFPCLVIKSVCDYADAHKNKMWQGYSAASAAACTKVVLEEWTTQDRSGQLPLSPRIDNRLSSIDFPHQDTCGWLLKSKEFQEWQDPEDLHSHNGVLWIKGKPGAGKSTLMKHTLSYCQETFEDHNIAAYSFNARGGALEKTVLGMFRSLMYQLIDKDDLLRNRFMLMFLDKHKKHGEEWEWNTGELKNFLLSERKKGHFQPWILLVDALDECNEAEVSEVVTFLESLSKNSVRAKVSVHILLSSRNYPTIDMKKRLQVVVENQEGHGEDIRAYVQGKLRTKNKDIEKEILRKADHIFMWVVLVVEILNQECYGRVKAMQKKLRELPSGLHEVFTIILEKDNPHKQSTVLALQWVLFAETQLKLEELYFAVLAGTVPEDLGPWDRNEDSREVMQHFITSISRGLIEIRSDRERIYVQFIHESVNDFLLRNGRLETLDPKLLEHPVGTSHEQLKDCCMAYILMRDLESHADYPSYSKQDLERSFPFLGYASKYVLCHSEHAQADQVSQRDFLRLLQDGGCFERIRIYVNMLGAKKLSLGRELCYALAAYGCYELLKVAIVNQNAKVNAQGGYYSNALQAASANRYVNIAKLLIEKGAKVNALGGVFGTALQAASLGSDISGIELLLKSGASIGTVRGKYGTALQAAAVRNEIGVIELLLKNRADVNTVGGFYGTALQAASVRGDISIVELLLRNGADVKTKGGFYGNALQASSAGGSWSIANLLLKNGAEVNALGGNHGTALQAAAMRGNWNVVELLLKNGADVDIQGGEYGTALQAASAEGYVTIVDLLLANGACVNALAGYYGTALQAAASKGGVTIVELLLKNGARVDIKGGVHGGAFMAASHAGSPAIMALLIENGAVV